MKATDHRQRICLWVLTASAVFLTIIAAAQTAQSPSIELGPGSAALIQPQQLVQQLQAASRKPLVLYVGPHILYAQLHIRGAEFIGPPSNPQSLDNLRKRMASLPQNQPVVLYCGCCPWEHCPNLQPAFAVLQKAGFTGVKVLYLAHNFGTDWVDKGYPVDRGQ